MNPQILQVFPHCDVNVHGDWEEVGITIQWDDLGIGFGELSLSTDINGKTVIDTESMGKEFFLDLMSKLYDMAEVK